MTKANIDSVSVNFTCKMRIYERLLDRIFTLEIMPGAWLDAQQLAQEMGTHRSQVMEALSRLEADGLIQASRNGYRVIQFDHHFITTVFSFRRTLELNAVKLCIEHLNSARVGRLRKGWTGFLNTDDPSLTNRYLKADLHLHHSIAAMTTNRPLQQLLDRSIAVETLIQNWLCGGRVSPQQVANAAQEHISVLDTMLAKNVDAAVAAMDAHLTMAHDLSLNGLDA